MFSRVFRQRAQRFHISLAVELTQAGCRRLSDRLTTLNVSASGVLMSAPAFPLEIGQELEYFVTLPTQPDDPQVRLRCKGRVVRRDGERSAVAASIEGYEFVSNSRFRQ